MSNSKPVWYRSLYWRVGLGFVAFLALLLVAQALLFVWLTSGTPSLVARRPAHAPADPPRILNVVRQKLKPGTSHSYEALETAIVAAFEAAQPAESGASRGAGRSPSRLRWAGAGLVVGVLATTALLRTPVSDAGIDYERYVVN